MNDKKECDSKRLLSYALVMIGNSERKSMDPTEGITRNLKESYIPKP